MLIWPADVVLNADFENGIDFLIWCNINEVKSKLLNPFRIKNSHNDDSEYWILFQIKKRDLVSSIDRVNV